MGETNSVGNESSVGGDMKEGRETGAELLVRRTSLWTRGFMVITVINFLYSVVYLLLQIVMSKVATDRFGVAPAVAGLSASIFVIGSFLTRPALGKRIHQIGQTKVLYVGAILSLALTLCYFAANSIGLLILIRLFHGAVHAIVLLAAGTIVACVVPQERYGEGIGYFMLGTTLSTAIGPFIGLILLRHGGFDPIIITCSVVLAISLVILPLLRVKDVKLTAEQRSEIKGFKLSNYIEPKTVGVGLTLMLTYLCFSSVSSFLALYSEQIKLTGAAGIFFIVYSVMIFLTRPLAGRRFDARGENSVMYPGMAIFAAGLVILAIAAHSAVLLLSAAVVGLGFGIVQACGRALVVKVTPLHRMGQATSTFYMFLDTGLGLGPLFCGLLVPVTGYRGMYGVMGFVAAASVAVYHALHGRRAGQPAAERVVR